MSDRSFTLIEVLVAVAIIMLLAALLMPALRSARARAKQVQCMSNLRQLGIGLKLYVTENGRFPGSQCSIGIASMPRIRQYTSYNHEIFWCPAANPAYKWKKNWTSTAPNADPYKAYFGYLENETVMTSSTPFTYGYNDWGTCEFSSPHLGLGAYADPAGSPHYYHGSYATLVNPSEMVTLGDSGEDYPNVGNWDMVIDPTPCTGAGDEPPADRHFRGASIVFADGHVVWDLMTNWVAKTDENMRR